MSSQYASEAAAEDGAHLQGRGGHGQQQIDRHAEQIPTQRFPVQRQTAADREVAGDKAVHAGMPLGEVAGQGRREDLSGFMRLIGLPIGSVIGNL